MLNKQHTVHPSEKIQNNTHIILFDLDGTLIDSKEAILESFAKAYEAFDNKIPDAKNIITLIGSPLEVMFEKLGVNTSQIAAYVHAYKAHYKTVYTQKTTLLPRVEEALVLAQKYGRLGIVTTKTSAYSRTLLEHFDIMKYFDILIGREDVTKPKPDPEPLKRAMHALGYEHTKAGYMIGDTAIDMIAAQKANITGIGVLCGYGEKEELEAYTDIVVKNAYRAAQFIEKVQTCP